MTSRVSAAMIKAMNLIIKNGLSPYAAANKAGIALSTMYRSELYKAWKNGKSK